MTYGWAILAIAIVMVSLYSLGIFSPSNFSPGATPGSCQVIRTVAQTSLAGQCNNLIPKYVGQFNGKAFVNISTGATLINKPGTISMWTYLKSHGGTDSDPTFLNSGSAYFALNPSSFLEFWNGASWINAGNGTVSLNSWHNIVISYTASVTQIYLDGKMAVSSVQIFQTGGVVLYIASRTNALGKGDGQSVDGYVSNIQIYNTSLDAATITSMYQKGVGGAPADLQHIVIWLPLNGNANDYSGNNHHGITANVIWSANWQSGYTAPTS